MPEGDAVFRTARALHAGLAGREITLCDLRWPSLATADLTGRTTLEVVPRGKHILHRVDGGLTLHSHLRMEGVWRVLPASEVGPARLRDRWIRAVIGCAETTALGVRLGMLDLVRTADEHRLVGHLGPDLLGADWDPDRAVANLLREPGRPIGAALLDQRNLAGVGTIWDAETLFAERVHPWTPAGELGPDKLRAIAVRAQALVEGAKERAPGNLRVHGRSGRPCVRCGRPLRISRIGEPPEDRVMFYCSTCQGGLGPGDDGRPQAPLGAPRRTDGVLRGRKLR